MGRPFPHTAGLAGVFLGFRAYFASPGGKCGAGRVVSSAAWMGLEDVLKSSELKVRNSTRSSSVKWPHT